MTRKRFAPPTTRPLWIACAAALAVLTYGQARASAWRVERESGRLSEALASGARELALRVERDVLDDQRRLETLVDGAETTGDLWAGLAEWLASDAPPVPLRMVQLNRPTRNSLKWHPGTGRLSTEPSSETMWSASPRLLETELDGPTAHIVRLAHPLMESPSMLAAAWRADDGSLEWLTAEVDETAWSAGMSAMIDVIPGLGASEVEVALIRNSQPDRAGVTTPLPTDPLRAFTGVSHENLTLGENVPFGSPDPMMRLPFGSPDRIRMTTPEPDRGLRLWVGLRSGTLQSAARANTRAARALGWTALGVLGAALILLLSAHSATLRLAKRQGEFITAISHELRTPVAVVRAVGENLADEVELPPRRLKQYGLELVREADRLGDTVEAALATARGEGLEPVPGTRTDVGPIVDLLAQIPSQPISVHITGSEIPTLMSPNALRTCLRNLIDNALRHGGGPSGVEIEVAYVGTQAPIEVSVLDRGPGIEDEDVGHLLEPFYRGRMALAEGVEGMGLGLSLTNTLAQRFGGGIEISPRDGGGLRVTLQLRAAV